MELIQSPSSAGWESGRLPSPPAIRAESRARFDVSIHARCVDGRRATLVVSPQRGGSTPCRLPNVPRPGSAQNHSSVICQAVPSVHGRTGTAVVIISGMSGAGKASALKTFEDLGYYCVDNLPVGLISDFAELVLDTLRSGAPPWWSTSARGRSWTSCRDSGLGAADVRPTVIFLEADEEALVRRYSETRRPHPWDGSTTVRSSLTAERRHLAPVRTLADLVIDTSKFNVHELRSISRTAFRAARPSRPFWSRA